MPLRIRDGYTVKGQTSGKGFTDADPIPVVHFEYRPPTAVQLAQFRFDQAGCRTGEELVKARAAFLHSRLVDWDVESGSGGKLPIVMENIARLPDEVLSDLVAECQKWRPAASQEQAAGNSGSASA